jgi:iron(III) transport system permease protein
MRLRFPLISALWLLLLGPPLAALAAELIQFPTAWSAWSETSRLLVLIRNTVLLIAGTLALSLPVGVVAAWMIFRTDLPGRALLRRLVVLILFVPLPLLVSAWQASLGRGGWFTLRIWETAEPSQTVGLIPWKPWAQGLPAAIWVHALAALPWIIWLSGQGFRWIEPHLEEDALTNAGAWRTATRVTLRRALPAIGVAALWVGIQTAGEITVTDMMQVRTFAEEVYNEFARPDVGGDLSSHDALARAIALSIPPTLLATLLIAWHLPRWQRISPPLAVAPDRLRIFRLGPWRWLVLPMMAGLILLLLGIPIGSLIWRTGQVPPGDSWSMRIAASQMFKAFEVQSLRLLESLAWAIAAGVVSATLGFFGCWIARDRVRIRAGMAFLLILVWTTSGPVIGLGLKEAINQLMNLEEQFLGRRFDLARALLYDGPSPVPVIWATAIRFLPCAAALIWPVVRLIPRELFETARTDGASAWQELRHVVWPLAWPTYLRALLAVTALSLGELSASKLVETPAGQTFAHEIFTQMHYGVTNHLAAMCLWLLILVAVVGLVWMGAEAIIKGRFMRE